MSEELSALIPQTDREKLTKVLEELNSYKQITITSDSEFTKADAVMNHYKNQISAIKKDREKAKEPHYGRYKYIIGFYDDIIKKTQNFVNQCGSAMGYYKLKKDKEAEELQKKLDADERKKKEIELQRAEHDRQVAEKLRAEGKHTQADKREAEADTHIENAAQTVARQVTKVEASGSYFKKVYSMKVIDFDAAIKHMAKDAVLRSKLQIIEKDLIKKYEADNEKLEIPGIEFSYTKVPYKKPTKKN